MAQRGGGRKTAGGRLPPSALQRGWGGREAGPAAIAAKK